MALNIDKDAIDKIVRENDAAADIYNGVEIGLDPFYVARPRFNEAQGQIEKAANVPGHPWMNADLIAESDRLYDDLVVPIIEGLRNDVRTQSADLDNATKALTDWVGTATTADDLAAKDAVVINFENSYNDLVGRDQIDLKGAESYKTEAYKDMENEVEAKKDKEKTPEKEKPLTREPVSPSDLMGSGSPRIQTE